MFLPEKLTICKRTIMFALTQGIAERACLVGEVLSRATPAYSGCEKLFHKVGIFVFLIYYPPGQMAALFTGQDAGGL